MFNYLALGDSITVGVGAPPKRGYVNILTNYFQHTHPVVYTKKIALGGWRSKDLLTALTRPQQQQLLPDSHLITLFIGGNDLAFAFVKMRLLNNPRPLYTAIKRFSIQCNRLIQIARSFSHAPIITATQYNPFPYSKLAIDFIQLLNKEIIKISQNYRIPVADMYTPFLGKEYALIDGYRNGKLGGFIPILQKNPIHPNMAGHKLIADSFFHTLKRTLEQKNRQLPQQSSIHDAAIYYEHPVVVPQSKQT